MIKYQDPLLQCPKYRSTILMNRKDVGSNGKQKKIAPCTTIRAFNTPMMWKPSMREIYPDLMSIPTIVIQIPKTTPLFQKVAKNNTQELRAYMRCPW